MGIRDYKLDRRYRAYMLYMTRVEEIQRKDIRNRIDNIEFEIDEPVVRGEIPNYMGNNVDILW